MSANKIHIDYETLLLKNKEEFFVSEIYVDDPGNNNRRKLTSKEKKLIVDQFFSRFFIQFFNKKYPETKNFIFGTLKLLQKDGKPFIYWNDSQLEEKFKGLNIDFENVESNIIFNLINNYEKMYDVSMLDDYNFFKNKL
tara:strand:- start:60448 stop:60864 length:417 start_codon:yes stop_codon:yes gene_type:complete